MDHPAPAPLTLRVSFTSDEAEQTTRYRLTCPELDLDAGPFPFRPPLDDDARAELRWYLERYYRWPVGPDAERGARIEANMEGWGRDLFAALFDHTGAARVWQQFRDAGRDADRPHLLTLDATDPSVLRQPWELLADEEGHLFALGVGIRRRLHRVQAARPRRFDLPVRVLMVVARPEGDGVAFIDPRASAQALLEAAGPLGPANVAVEFLHPPTLKALTDRLRDKDRPPVHVVHFDGHGVYAARRGLGTLLFEGAGGGAITPVDRVDADRLGTLLTRAQVPLMVLDACQSAHADAPDPYSSVAARLIRAGVGSVVAMQYSVLVETSKRFMAAFYRALAQGQSVGRAVDEGRYELLSDTYRHTLHRPDGSEQDLHLRDWFLPALYQQRADPAPFARAAPPAPAAPSASTDPTIEAAGETPRGAPLLGDFPAPRYGFVGRAKELWRLERLFYERRVVVLHGFGGQGKTALAGEAARWLTRTGRFRRALFLSFEGGGDADWAAAQMGRRLLGEDFAALGREERLPALQALLAEAPTLIVWDNFESLLPGADAELPPDALQALLDLGATLTALTPPREPSKGAPSPVPGANSTLEPSKGAPSPVPGANSTLDLSKGAPSPVPGANSTLEPPPGRGLGASPKTFRDLPHPPRLLITTRDPDLPHDAFRPSPRAARLPLGGLEPWEGLELAGTVLDSLGHPRPPRPDLQRLLRFLGGHPLSIQLALPHLKDYADVAAVIARFEELYPGFTEGRARERNESLEVSLSFSLRRLSQGVQARLPALGVFAGGAMEDDLLAVTGLSEEDWQPARDELLRAGLMTEERIPNVRFPYYHFHPTLCHHLRRRLGDEQRAELEKSYRERYYAVSVYLYRTDTRDPQTARAVALRELPNLRRALDLTLAAGDPATAIAFAEYVERFLNLFGRWREREALVGRVATLAGPGEAAGAGLTKAEYLLKSRRGELFLDQGRAAEAEKIFRELLARMDQGTAYDGIAVGYNRAMTLWRLGRALRSQGRPAEAEREYRRALAVLGGLDPAHEDVRRQTGAVHTDLADVLRHQGRYAEAREQYEESLRVKETLEGEERGKAVVLGQLGTLALVQGDYPEARARYREALERFRALGESRMEAVAWHQLGMAAQRAADGAQGPDRAALLEEAEAAYRESLRLKEALGDRAGAATSANQLAIVARMAGRPADAERWYRRTLEDAELLPDQGAAVYNNLANLLLDLHRRPAPERPPEFAGRDLLAEAQAWAEKAREIREEIGDPSLEIWKTYSILADIAEARGEAGAARAWRRKARAAYVAFPGHWARLGRQWGPVVEMVGRTASPPHSPPLSEALETRLQQAESQGWGHVVAALRDILAGARDAEVLVETHDLDSEDYLIVVKTLEALEGGEAPQPGPPPAPPGAADVHPAVRGLAPLVLGVVALCAGQEALRPQIEPALADLAGQEDWRALVGALRRLLAGERERADLAAGLDAVDVQLLDLALGALSGDEAALARLTRLAEQAQQQAAQAGDLQEMQRAFRAWLETPAGQAAMQAVQAQGLPPEAAMEQLLAHFLNR